MYKNHKFGSLKQSNLDGRDWLQNRNKWFLSAQQIIYKIFI